MSSKDLWIIIAAYNEERMIAKVIASLKRHGYHNIIVTDDCSRDRTGAVAARAGAVVLRHAINRGQGAALQTGVAYALSQGADYLVHFDADGQHRAEEIARLLKPVRAGKVDIAIGSRFLSVRSQIPWFRTVLLKGSVIILRLFYGLRVSDAHNGFRAMSAHAAREIEITQDRMEHASEIIELIARKRLRWCEVPVHIDYTDYSLQKGAGSLVGGLRILGRMLFKRLVN